MTDYRVIIAGSRSFNDYELLREQCLSILQEKMRTHRVKAAGMVRNAEMAKCSDALIAFWDGESSGTRHMINFARKRGLDISIIDLNQPRSQITDVKPSMENEGNEHIGESIPNNHQYKR